MEPRSGIHVHLKNVGVFLPCTLTSHFLAFSDIMCVTNWLSKTFCLKVVSSCWARCIWNLSFVCVTAYSTFCQAVAWRRPQAAPCNRWRHQGCRDACEDEGRKTGKSEASSRMHRWPWGSCWRCSSGSSCSFVFLSIAGMNETKVLLQEEGVLTSPSGRIRLG